MKSRFTLLIAVFAVACVTGKPIPSTTPMVKVQGGTFLSGYSKPCEQAFTCQDLIGGTNENISAIYPPMQVTVSTFYIDTHEVTNAQYDYCVQSGVCKPRKADTFKGLGGIDYNHSPVYADYPVIGVTLQEAQLYCKFVGKRLPTEFEWELAAMGGHKVTKETDKVTYLYPNQISDFEHNFIKHCAGVHMSGCGDEFVMPDPIESNNKDKVTIGDKAIYDLTGNVAEIVKGIPVEPYSTNNADIVASPYCADDLPKDCKSKYCLPANKVITDETNLTTEMQKKCEIQGNTKLTWYFGKTCDQGCTDSYVTPETCTDKDVFFMCQDSSAKVPICKKRTKPIAQEDLFDEFQDNTAMKTKMVIKGCSFNGSCGGYSGSAAVCGARANNRYILPSDDTEKWIGFRCASDAAPE